MDKKIKSNGFSLIELLVVLGIIAVLTGLIAFNFNTARMRARDVQRKNDLKELRSALELYKNDNNQVYPDMDYTTLIGTLDAAGYVQSTMQDPKLSVTGDPASWDEYEYLRLTATSYTISMCFENRADPFLDDSTTDCGPAGVGRLYVYDNQ